MLRTLPDDSRIDMAQGYYEYVVQRAQMKQELADINT